MPRKPRYRCKLSDEGKLWLRPRDPDKLGWTTGGDGKYCHVTWDGNSSITSYHLSFIEVMRDLQKPEAT